MFLRFLSLWLLCLPFVEGQLPNPRVTHVDGIPLEWVTEPQPGTAAPAVQFLPTPLPQRPLSMRLIYRPVYRTELATILADNTTRDELGLLVINGDGFKAGGITPDTAVNVFVKLLDPTATSCLGAAWAGGQPATANPAVLPLAKNYNNGAYFILPNDPTVSTPHEFMMPWLCVCAAVGSTCPDNNWVHTNMRYALTEGCLGDNPNYAAKTVVDLLPANPILRRHMCQTAVGPAPDGTASPYVVPDVRLGEVDPVSGLASRDSVLFRERQLRTKCCGWRDAYVGDSRNVHPGTGVRYGMKIRLGMCINPLLQSCCDRFDNSISTNSSRSLTVDNAQGGHANLLGAVGGVGKPFSRFREKCCYGGLFNSLNQNSPSGEESPAGAILAPDPTITSYLEDWCPCQASNTQTHCLQQVPPVSGPAGCCIARKYPELIGNGTETPLWGRCYDGIVLKCCDTGDLYDPGSQQCCAINGVQSVNRPCPCSSDLHCGNNQTCCQDITRPMFPTPHENVNFCNKYQNFPGGTGPAEAQPCIGQCIDSRFQICCNGMACMDEYEVCCNNTCCNKFDERCTQGLREGAAGRRLLSNNRDFRQPYEVCTSIEGMTPFRATVAFFLPLCLLAATVISLFGILNFGKRHTALQPMSVYEASTFIFAAISILLGWPLFFTNIYKYGIVWVWVMFIVMLAALSQIRILNLIAIVVLFLLLNYIVDPFYGNEILSLPIAKDPPSSPGIHGWSGVFYSLVMDLAGDYSTCTSWYDIFRRDGNVQDARYENPTFDAGVFPFSFSHRTYGFCARGWFFTLMVLEGINLIATFLCLVLLLAMHLRNVLFEKAQKTDDVVRQPWY